MNGLEHDVHPGAISDQKTRKKKLKSLELQLLLSAETAHSTHVLMISPCRQMGQPNSSKSIKVDVVEVRLIKMLFLLVLF